MAISAPGVGSGVDVNSIITQLISLERKPIQRIQSQIGGLQTGISAWGQIQSGLSRLRDASASLLDNRLWQGNIVSSGNPATLEVSASGPSPAGSYEVKVNALAQSQSVRSTHSFVAGAPLGTSGRLEFTQGSWNAGSFTASGSGLSVTVASTDTPSQIAAKINNLNAGVNAVVVRSGTQENLVLKSSQTGASQGFEVRAFDADDNLITDGLTGLGSLSYFNNGTSVVGLTLTQSAQDALIEIDGITVSSATNTFSEAISGLSLQAKSVSASPVSLTVASNTTAMAESVKAFQKAFNDLSKTIKDLTRSDPNGAGNGPLRGDQAAIGLLSMLRNIAGSNVSGANPSRLSDIGLIFDRNGDLSLNDASLQSSLSNFNQVRNLFADATSGIARQMNSFVVGAQASNGAVSSREQTLRNAVTRKGEEINRLEDRLTRSEQRLRAQYTALDVKMAQYSGLSNYIAQQLGAWNKPG